MKYCALSGVCVNRRFKNTPTHMHPQKKAVKDIVAIVLSQSGRSHVSGPTCSPEMLPVPIKRWEPDLAPQGPGCGGRDAVAAKPVTQRCGSPLALPPAAFVPGTQTPHPEAMQAARRDPGREIAPPPQAPASSFQVHRRWEPPPE